MFMNNTFEVRGLGERSKVLCDECMSKETCCYKDTYEKVLNVVRSKETEELLDTPISLSVYCSKYLIFAPIQSLNIDQTERK